MDEERKFDLDERTFQFALAIRKLVGSYRWTREQWTDVDQVLRSSGSVASNYAEANNPVSSADFSFRLKICRKESGESRLWIRLLAGTSNDDRIPILRGLFKEADELTRTSTASSRSSATSCPPLFKTLRLVIERLMIEDSPT